MDDREITPPINPRCWRPMPEVKFSQKAVRRALSSLDIHKTSLPDGISLLMHRSCAPELTPELRCLLRLSYSVGVVSELWNSAHIHPILKKGDGFYLSLTSLLSKVIESIINSQILIFLQDHRLINDRRYVSNDCQYRDHLESKAKLGSKTLWVISRPILSNSCQNADWPYIGSRFGLCIWSTIQISVIYELYSIWGLL